MLGWLRARAAQVKSRPYSVEADLLAEYAAVSTKAREADRQRRALRREVDELPVDVVFGGWRKRLGAPKEIVDADAVEALLAQHGLAVPMKETAPSLIVEYVGDRQEVTDAG